MLKQNDFIELEFIGRVKNGEIFDTEKISSEDFRGDQKSEQSQGRIFDTNIKHEAKKIGLEIENKPLVICLGQAMILPAIDNFLIGKEIGEYNLELTPDKAFGFRKRDLLRLIPISVFYSQKVAPETGMVFQFDNMLGKITSVSGGRVMVDFNNPLANKEVIYDLKVKRVLTDIHEKVKSLLLSLFGKEFKFHIEADKLIIEADKKIAKFFEMFKEKFKEILNLELHVKEVEEKSEKKEEKEEENN